MKQQIKKWSFRLAVTGLFIMCLLVMIVLNPILLYASHTTQGNYTVYHTQQLDPLLAMRMDNATRLLRNSELYNPELKLNICLNDGGAYPVLMKKIRGRAFAWGFHHEVVLQGSADYAHNYVELNGYKWNLTQLLAHEAVHCMQYDQMGLWKTNPLAHMPHWKLEGYPEYIARHNADQKDLLKNISLLIATEQTDHNGWINFADGTGTMITYYKGWLLMQYCLDVKKMTYKQVLQDQVQETAVDKEMMEWYAKQNIKHRM